MPDIEWSDKPFKAAFAFFPQIGLVVTERDGKWFTEDGEEIQIAIPNRDNPIS